MALTKSWILTHSTNYQADGKLFLGQVLTNPLDAETALISGKPRTLPATLHIDETRAENALMTSQDLLAKSGGFWLQTYGVDYGVSGEAGSLARSNIRWEVEGMVGKVTTFSFDYVLRVLAEEDVKNWVRNRLSPVPPTLYIITGLRIFEGATLSELTVDNVSTMQGSASGDGAPKLPLQGGFDVQRTNAQHMNQAFKKTSDFVFAYQCNKINYFPWKRMSPYSYGETASSETASDDANDQGTGDLDVDRECPVKLVEFGASGEADDVPHHTETVSSAEGETTEVTYPTAAAGPVQRPSH